MDKSDVTSSTRSSAVEMKPIPVSAAPPPVPIKADMDVTEIFEVFNNASRSVATIHTLDPSVRLGLLSRLQEARITYKSAIL